MKKIILICIPILIFIASLLFIITNKKVEKFYLEEQYYGNNTTTEIEFDELKKLIDNKKSFGIFIYQPMCVTSSNFESVLKDFQKDYQISFYKIAFSKVKNTKELKFLNYYPSFIIYKEGKKIDFLESDKDEDVKYYESKDGFKNWFTTYVNLKENDYKKQDNNTNITPEDNKNNNQNVDNKENNNTTLNKIKLDNVVRDNNKVNIYFFWGQGCPHCEEETKFFNSIEKKYGEYYNLYKFEVWYNEENAKLLNAFATSMGDEANGVPYTIIGNNTYKGFDNSSKRKFKKAIKEQHNNSFDVYFDKLNK